MDGLTAQLGDLLAKTEAGETGGQSRTEGRLSAGLIPDRVAENLPNLLFRAAAVSPGAALKPGLHFLIELPND
jgi:hypothetical protein